MSLVLQFRGRNDDGNEQSATWKAPTNTNFTAPTNTNFRIRFTLNDIGAAYGYAPQLQYRRNTGTWTAVTLTTSVVRFTSSIHVADQTSTTQQLGEPLNLEYAQSFQPGNVATSGTVTSIILFRNQYTEVEYCIQILSSGVSSGDSITLRLGGTLVGATSPMPVIIV